MAMTKEEALEYIKSVREFYATMEKFAQTKDEAKFGEALDMAIEALQRENPKNPIINYVADFDGARRLNDGWTEDSYLCPVCHTYFGEIYEEGYCRKCGQKLIQKRVRVIKE